MSQAAARALQARLLRDRSLQFDLTPPPPPPPPPPWLKALLDFLGALGKGLNAVIGPLMPLLKILFWVGVAAGLALLAWLIIRELLAVNWARRRRERAGRAAPADWAPDPRRARALLENADRLAAAGRFDQAVRLILHRSIEDIEAHRPRLVRPAQTARELAALEAVPPPARTAFARIAAVVEFSAFAGRPIGREAFDTCRQAYEAFAFAGAWA